MAENKRIILEIDVNDKDIQSLNSELEKTQKNFKDTQREADKTSSSIKDVGDNGGAIAILDEFTGGLATKMRDAAEASKLFSGSLKGIRTALVATGIGALVVAIGTLVVYWEDINDWVERVNKGLEVQLETTRKIKDATSAELELLNKKIENAELQGKANEELQKQRNKLLADLQVQNEAEVKILENQLARLKATQAEVNLWDELVDGIVEATLGQEALARRQAERFAGNIQAIKELEQAIAQAKLEGIDLEMVLFNLDNPQTEGSDQEREDATILGFSTSKARTAVDERKAMIEAWIQQDNEYTRTAQRLTGFRLDLNEKEKLSVEEIAEVTGMALNGLSALAGENAGIQKVIGIAQATIDTFIGANKALAQGGIFGSVAAGAIIATGLANVTRIATTKIPTPSGSSNIGGLGGASSPSIPSPSFNVVGNTGVNQLANVVGEQLGQPVRAYITTGDVNSAQQLENDTISNASLG